MEDFVLGVLNRLSDESKRRYRACKDFKCPNYHLVAKNDGSAYWVTENPCDGCKKEELK